MNAKPGTILLALVIFGAMVALLFFLSQGATPDPRRRGTPPPNPPEKVQFAVKDIAVGEKLTADNVQWTDWPPGRVPKDGEVGEGDFIGQCAATAFRAGEFIRPSKLGACP
ncbi:MAG: SAF domain-containing protein [Methylobacteriaceae bacterium]|jgi:pilus assembly protein CpaB|nr:SAF domain-containing protein [Methylobacteriaceae bacterium]